MKKSNKLIASIAVISALVVSININGYAESGKIKGDSVRLRSKASKSSEAIDVYSNGEKLEILETLDEWYKVKIDGQTGYIYKDYVSVSEDTTKKEEEKKENEEEKETEQEEKKEEQEEKEPEKEEKKKEEENKQEKVEIKLGKTKATSTQRIYIIPNLGASVIGEVKKDAEVDIIQEANGWVYISTSEAMGWTRYNKIVTENVTNSSDTNADENKQEEKKEEEKKEEETKKEEEKKEEEKSQERKAYISGSGVNLRAKAGKKAEVIDVLSLNTEVIVTAEDDEWCKVKVGSKVGYVSKQFVSDKKTETTSRSNTEERSSQTKTTTAVTTSSSSGVTGQDIVDYAMQFKGYPYVYAAADPSVGFDCSGLAWYVYKHFGYNIERSSRGLATDGKTISNKSDLQPGDVLVFLAYNDYSRVGHVGIYIGNNQFIHANDESTGVIITSLEQGKYPERFVSGRRFID